ncbi:MAG TPA: OB-fold nucleic acid binding domain-containing protein [archaeon]|jgi:ssDNA-binding replication factor A large subunit|nr:OB-fold nucleic acid binding domain-containing protein [Candidatus ainarchaeum sp.]HPM86011.1 OB-fold nucleic acid binding domain-containing protein [archaeon]
MIDLNTTELISQIAGQTGKTPEEIKSLIDAKVQKFSGLLTEQGAIYMVQKELGLKQETMEQIAINDLKEGMKGIEIKGEITAVFPVKEFDKNGKKGKLRSFILNDSTGEVRVTLWNEQVDQFPVTRGNEIIITNIFVKLYNDTKQVTLGFNGKIEIKNKKEIMPTKLAELKSAMSSVGVLGRIMRKFPCKDFESGERKGKLCSFQLADESAIIRATAWNEKADEIEKYNEGDAIEIENAYTKEGRFGVELHLGYSADIKETTKSVPSQIELLKDQTELKKITDTNEGENAVIEGKIISIEKGNLFYTVCSKCGKKITSTTEGYLCDNCGETTPKKNPVLSIILKDDSASIKVSFFGKNVLKAIGIEENILEEKINLIGAEKVIEELNENIFEKKLKIFGYTKINSFSGNKEFIARELIE